MNDVEKLRIALEGLIKNREEIDHITDVSMYLNVKACEIALDKINIYEPSWDEVHSDSYNTENPELYSKCLLSQNELKNTRKELRKTIDTMERAIPDLKELIDKLEYMYERVNNGCMD